VRRNEFAIGSAAVAIVLAAIGAFKGDDTHELRDFLVVAAIILVAAGIMFWLIVPRVTRLGRGALILGVLGFLSNVVFWLGLPSIFAGAAASLALGARTRGSDSRAANAALALAGLTVIVATVLAFIG
jgi:hypothetical protein